MNSRLINLSINCLQQKGCCVNKDVIYASKLMAFIHCMPTHPFNISVRICNWKCYSLQIIWIRPRRIFHTLKRRQPFQIVFWICRDQPVFLVLSKHLEQKGVEVGKSAIKISTILDTQILIFIWPVTRSLKSMSTRLTGSMFKIWNIQIGS